MIFKLLALPVALLLVALAYVLATPPCPNTHDVAALIRAHEHDKHVPF